MDTVCGHRVWTACVDTVCRHRVSTPSVDTVTVTIGTIIIVITITIVTIIRVITMVITIVCTVMGTDPHSHRHRSVLSQSQSVVNQSQ